MAYFFPIGHQLRIVGEKFIRCRMLVCVVWGFLANHMSIVEQYLNQALQRALPR